MTESISVLERSAPLILRVITDLFMSRMTDRGNKAQKYDYRSCVSAPSYIENVSRNTQRSDLPYTGQQKGA
jgi:hypothetical protein